MESFLSGGSVGSSCRSVQNAELNASTLSLSLVDQSEVKASLEGLFEMYFEMLPHNLTK